MFQFPAFASLTQVRDTALIRGGLSHSEITGSRDICASPVLFAAYHVLHRLQEPRHPPCALFFLTKYHHHPIKGDGHTSCLFLYWFCLFFQHVIELIPSRGEREGTESDRQAARRGPRPGTPCGHQSARITQDSGQLPGSPPSLIHRLSGGLQKGGVPAAPSGTATLLRLSPNHRFYPRATLEGTHFRHPRLSWLDGRCVQGPGTYSPRHG